MGSDVLKYPLALLITISTANAVDWDANPYDKISHIAIGGAVACAVTHYTQNRWYGILSSTLIGAIKESTDQHFDNADLVSWAAGGLVGSLCFQF